MLCKLTRATPDKMDTEILSFVSATSIRNSSVRDRDAVINSVSALSLAAILDKLGSKNDLKFQDVILQLGTGIDNQYHRVAAI